MAEDLTMAQMAKELNVSQRIVSAVINNKTQTARVSQATKERIKNYLEQRGYVQSKSALQIKNGFAENTIGILYCGKFMYFSHLIKALSILSETIEQQHGIVDITGVLPDKMNDGLREQVGKGIKRLIWIYTKGAKEEMKNQKILFPILARMDKVVIYNYEHLDDQFKQECLGNGIHLVGFDRQETYLQVANIFEDVGCGKVALDEVLFDNPQVELNHFPQTRLSFEEKGFDIYGLCPSNVYEISDDELAEALANNLIYHHKRHQVDCAFIRNDLMSTGVINILLKNGIKVPEDISIIGFGDLPLAKFQPVPLTTFRHPVEAMCQKTMELLEEKSSTSGEIYNFKSEFVSRCSHKKIKEIKSNLIMQNLNSSNINKLVAKN